MAADNVSPPALTLPPLPPLSAPSSRFDRDFLAAPAPPSLPTPSLGSGPLADKALNRPPAPAGHPPPLPPPLPPPHDASLDPAIKHLLDQQAEIQAKLAVLLPQKYGPNIKVELQMLRHKYRVLRAYADDHREPPSTFRLNYRSIPVHWSDFLD